MTPTRYAEACERAAAICYLYAEECERAAAICYLTAGPPEYRSGMAHRMVTDAEDLRALAQALREAKAWAEWLPKPDNAPKVYALTLPTETGA